MAKSKSRPDRSSFLSRLIRNGSKPVEVNKPDVKAATMGAEVALAQIALAGCRVLQAEYGWTVEQAAEWLDKTLDQVEGNKVANQWIVIATVVKALKGEFEDARK